MSEQIVRIALIGFGAVNQTLCTLLCDQTNSKYAPRTVKFKVVAVSDSSGGLMTSNGNHELDIQALMAHKKAKKALKTMSLKNGFVLEKDDDCEPSEELAANAPYDILVDSSPSSKDGNPGLNCIHAALKRGKSVVLANKSPLVVAYEKIMAQAAANGAKVAFSATVCGGLPVVNVGQRDLVHSKISKVEGIFNSTSNYVLSQLLQGASSEEAIAEAQRRGIAEADPTLDLEGWDTASKLVIIANAVLRQNSVKLSDVGVTGVEKVTAEDLKQAREKEEAIKLVARATLREDGTYSYSVKPESVDANSFLGRCSDTEMCISFHTDIFENMFLKTDEKGVVPTSAAVLRDLYSISQELKTLSSDGNPNKKARIEGVQS